MALREINVDFNDVSDGDQVVALLESAPQNMVAQDEILAVDREGNQCQGRVTDVDVENGLVYIALDLGTWIAREAVPTTGMAFPLEPMSGNGRDRKAELVRQSERTTGRVHSLV